MSVAVSVEITVLNFSHNKSKQIAKAIHHEWPCDQWELPSDPTESNPVLFGRGDGDLHLDPLVFVERLADATAKANEAPCQIEVKINGETYSGADHILGGS